MLREGARRLMLAFLILPGVCLVSMIAALVDPHVVIKALAETSRALREDWPDPAPPMSAGGARTRARGTGPEAA